MTKQEVFLEMMIHLTQDEVPSEYLNRMSEKELFSEYPLNLLLKMKDTEQSKKYHPEGSVWNHTMMVVDEAAKVRNQSKDYQAFMWAALLHDIGKPPTTKVRKGKITSYDHEKVGAELSKEFLMYYTSDQEFIIKVCALVRWHMQILFVVNDLPYGEPREMIKEVNVHEISLLSWCDRMGRGGADPTVEVRNGKIFKDKIRKMQNSK
jgi:putative nucleotidyltransferase with HDIG domain